MVKEDKQFVYYWYKEFNWKKNPFEPRILEPVSKFIAGYEKERRKINYFVIDKLPVIIINGKEGYGKTTLLSWLKEELTKYKGVVIVDYITKEINFAKFVKILLDPLLTLQEKFAGFGSKINSKALSLIKDKNLVSIYEALYFRKTELDLNKIKEFLLSRLKEKSLVLIVDDFNTLDEKLILLLKVLLESEINVQVAISTDTNVEKISKKEAIRLTLDGLNENECKEMLNFRLINVGGSGITPFNDEILKAIYKRSKGNPKTFLDLCKEKAVNIALNNLNLKKELVVEKKTEEVKSSTAEKDEVSKEQILQEKTYEVKVVNNQTEKPYNIVVQGKPKIDHIPKQIKKEKTKAERIR